MNGAAWGGLRKAAAFIRRDLVLLFSYRVAFALQFLGIAASILTFYFVAMVFGKAVSPHLEKYGGDYFSFVLVGIAFYGYMGASLSAFSGSIREGQMMGTLEAMLVTPTRLSTILVCSSLWTFTITSLRVVGFFLIGYLFFHLDLSRANLGAALLIQVLTIVAFSSIGIVAASFIMVFKQGNPIEFFVHTGFSLLGGVFYPVSVLPGWLQPFSRLLPITYSLDGMRLAMLQGYSIGALAPQILSLAAFSAVLLPFGLYCFRLAARKARRDGTLTQY